MLDASVLALAGIGLLVLASADQPRQRVTDRLTKVFGKQDGRNGGLEWDVVKSDASAFALDRPSDRPPEAVAWVAQQWGLLPACVVRILMAARIALGLLLTLSLAALIVFFSRNSIGFLIASGASTIVGFPVAWMLVRSYLRDQIEKRTQRVAHAMPNAMDLLLISLASGSSLESSLERVAFEMRQDEPEIANELAVLKADLVVLGDYDKAFGNLALRVPAATVSDMASLIRDSLKNGAPIREALSTAITMQRKQAVIYMDQLGNEIPAKITTATLILCFPPLLMVIGGPPLLGLIAALSS